MNDEESKPLCDAARELRAAIGDTQQQFAGRLGLAISTVVRYELSRPPSGAALAMFARTAEGAERQDLASVFLAALAKEFGLHQNLGMLTDKFLWVALDTGEQRKAALAFDLAFSVHFHPERYHKPPSPESRAAAAKMLKDLKAAADATWPGKKTKGQI